MQISLKLSLLKKIENKSEQNSIFNAFLTKCFTQNLPKTKTGRSTNNPRLFLSLILTLWTCTLYICFCLKLSCFFYSQFKLVFFAIPKKRLNLHNCSRWLMRAWTRLSTFGCCALCGHRYTTGFPARLGLSSRQDCQLRIKIF